MEGNRQKNCKVYSVSGNGWWGGGAGVDESGGGGAGVDESGVGGAGVDESGGGGAGVDESGVGGAGVDESGGGGAGVDESGVGGVVVEESGSAVVDDALAATETFTLDHCTALPPSPPTRSFTTSCRHTSATSRGSSSLCGRARSSTLRSRGADTTTSFSGTKYVSLVPTLRAQLGTYPSKTASLTCHHGASRRTPSRMPTKHPGSGSHARPSSVGRMQCAHFRHAAAPGGASRAGAHVRVWLRNCVTRRSRRSPNPEMCSAVSVPTDSSSKTKPAGVASTCPV